MVFNSKGIDHPLPFDEGDVISFCLFMDPFESKDIINEYDVPDVLWCSEVFPECNNDNYDDEAGTMLFRAEGVTNPENSYLLRWLINHEDTLFAIATKENEKDLINSFPHHGYLKVRMNLTVTEIVRGDDSINSGGIEYYAILLPVGKREGEFIESEVVLVGDEYENYHAF